MKILLSYFSATGNTAKMAGVIKESLEELGAEVDVHSITALSEREQTPDFTPYQAFIFGMPIHSWRAPRVVREWLGTLDGGGRKCAMFFTYGGFGVHPSHYSTRQILTERHFVTVSSAEFLGAHTFNLGGWQAVPDRPDQSDFDTARVYAEKTYRRFTGEDPGILGELEKTDISEKDLDSIESFRFNVVTQVPDRDGQDCSMCMICEESCPTGAMDAQAGRADRGKCIVCLGCVANCPDQVLKINDLSPSWDFKLQMEKETAEDIKGKQSLFYL